MPDSNTTEPDTHEFKDAAQRSQEAGVADEAAAYTAADTDEAPASLDEGDAKSKDDGTFTSDTD